MRDGKDGNTPDTGNNAEALTLALLDRDMLQAALDCAQLEKEELKWRLDELRKGVYEEQPTRNLDGHQLERTLLHVYSLYKDLERESSSKIQELELELNHANLAPRGNTDRAQDAIRELQSSLKAYEGSEKLIQELTDKNLALEEALDTALEWKSAYESVIHLDAQVKEEYSQVQVSLLEEIDVQASLLELAKERMDELQRVIAIREEEMGCLKESNLELQATLQRLQKTYQESDHASELEQKNSLINDLEARLKLLTLETCRKSSELERIQVELTGSIFHVKVVEAFLPKEFSEKDVQKLVLPVYGTQGLLNKANALVACLHYREPFTKGDVPARQKLDQLIISATQVRSRCMLLFEAVRFSVITSQGLETLQTLTAAVTTELDRVLSLAGRLDLIHSITPDELDGVATRLSETIQAICPSDVIGHPLLHAANANGLLDVLLSYQKNITSTLIYLEQNGYSNRETMLLITSSTKLHMAISQLLVIFDKNPSADETAIQEIFEHTFTLRAYNDGLSQAVLEWSDGKEAGSKSLLQLMNEDQLTKMDFLHNSLMKLAERLAKSSTPSSPLVEPWVSCSAQLRMQNVEKAAVKQELVITKEELLRQMDAFRSKENELQRALVQSRISATRNHSSSKQDVTTSQLSELKSLRARGQSDLDMITELKRELQVVRSALAAINSKSQVPKSPLRKVLVRDVTSTPGADHRTDSILTILWNENTNLKSIIQRLGATALAASPLGNQKSDHSSDSSVTHDRLKQIQMKSRSEQTERLVVDLSKTKEQQKWVQLARKPASQLSSQVELLLELSMKYHEALQIVVPCS